MTSPVSGPRAVDYFDFYEMPPWGTGAAHCVTTDPQPQEPTLLLADGTEVEPPAKKIGFY